MRIARRWPSPVALAAATLAMCIPAAAMPLGLRTAMWGMAAEIRGDMIEPLPIHRFYSKAYKGHFFTISEEEKDDLIAHNPNWRYEGTAYKAYTNEATGTTALFRFYSKGYRGHFFMIDEDEMWTLRETNPNWKYEGIAYYVYPNRRADPSRTATAIYRFWSKGYRHHFFTIDEDEMWTLRETNPNWKNEGVAFYAIP